MENFQIIMILIQLIITYAGAAIGWVLGKKKAAKSQEARIDNAIKLLLKQSLMQMHEDYIVHDMPISQSAKEQATEIFQLYSEEFKGNGVAQSMYNEIMAKPVRKED